MSWFSKAVLRKSEAPTLNNQWAEVAKKQREEAAKKQYELVGAHWLELVGRIEEHANKGRDYVDIDYKDPLFGIFSSDVGGAFLKERGLASKTEIQSFGPGLWLRVRWA